MKRLRNSIERGAEVHGACSRGRATKDTKKDTKKGSTKASSCRLSRGEEGVSGEDGIKDEEKYPKENTKENSNKESALADFYKAWAWKREHRPDRDRFKRPYLHPFTALIEGVATPITLKINQAPFSSEGFASTVWDSSIVVAKMLERGGAKRYKGRSCLDLSAGCGLIAVVMAQLEAEVTATDLEPNLPLLRTNCDLSAPGRIRVAEHTWGHDMSELNPPFDVIVACDVMYITEAVQDLVRTLRMASDVNTEIVVAHGRNRFAESAFLREVKPAFIVKELGVEALDPDFTTSDVAVYSLTCL